MIHLRQIWRITGILLFIEAGLLLLCALFPLCRHEDDLYAFLMAGLITLCAGELFVTLGGKEGKERGLGRRDGYIIVTLSWFIFSLFGALPFYISQYLPTFTDSFFETMSGFTTTGATILRDIEILPHGLLFWRSFTQWMGGLGIVFFTVAVLPLFGGGDVQLFAAEATGPLRGKLHPRISVSGRWIITVYITLTVACTVALRICGMNLFDGINHALCTIATGGYSTKNLSIAYFGSHSIEYTIMLFMFLAGINYGLLFYLLFRGNIKRLINDSEFKWYATTLLFFALILGFGLRFGHGESCGDSIRHSLFQTLSAITTTGYSITNYEKWPAVLWMILSFCMCMGACAGSTSGAMKSIRTLVLFKTLRNEFNRILHPNAILPVRLSGKTIAFSTKQSVLAFTIFYVGIIFLAWVTFMAMGFEFTDAYGASVCFVGNTGLAVGQLGTEISWAELPVAGKWFCCLLMIVSRLEIFSVLLIFTPSFWKRV